MRLPVELGPLRHPQGHHEGALDLDLDVGQGLEEGGLGHQLLVHGVLQADGAAVRPAAHQLRLQRRVQQQRVPWGQSTWEFVTAVVASTRHLCLSPAPLPVSLVLPELSH